MVGSYPPKETVHAFTTPEEDLPSGALARGTYTVHSLFTDDDKHEHLKVCNRIGRFPELHTPLPRFWPIKY
jgi:hypothetical protein